jgi:polysaccharide pyruvyl transferase WcaK-like protein
MTKIAILAANFYGNVGDLYILNAVSNFLGKEFAGVQMDVYPNSWRFDRRVACGERINLAPGVTIQAPRFAIYRRLLHCARSWRWAEWFLSKFYLSALGGVFRSVNAGADMPAYDAIVSVGGEMDTPYSFLDIQPYLKEMLAKRALPVVYGPISLQPKLNYINFYKKIFSSVEMIAIRDPKSMNWLGTNGISNTRLVPDCAFLNWTGGFSDRGDRNKIGICLHPSWLNNIGYAFNIIERAISAAKKMDCGVVFFPTHAQEDYFLYSLLLERYRDRAGVEFSFPTTSDDLIKLSRSLSLVISDRLHALLVGMLQGANILPILSRHKVVGYYEYVGLEHAVGLKDGYDLIESKIILAQRDGSLEQKLSDFCKVSQMEIVEFYRDQLRSLKAR